MLRGDHLVEGNARGWPAILTRKEHELAVARFEREARPRGRPRRRHVAVGILTCGECVADDLVQPLLTGGVYGARVKVFA